MKTKKEIKKWLLKHATDEYGAIVLEGIDFGNINLDFQGIKAATIYNSRQEAYAIGNDEQKATAIDNSLQVCDELYRQDQWFKEIHSSEVVIQETAEDSNASILITCYSGDEKYTYSLNERTDQFWHYGTFKNKESALKEYNKQLPGFLKEYKGKHY